jgi:DNA repair exonuclease SbcCD nuclease subunit
MTLHAEAEVVLKLLHTADWHLGRKFAAFRDEDATTLSRARMTVLDRILGAAERHAVDAVLCAGDLFDEPTPGKEWWEGLAQRLQQRRWENRPVFLLPGNHDPLLPDSIWDEGHPFRSALPPWVHVIDRDLCEHPLSANAVLYAVPCRSRAGQSDPTERIPHRAPGDERIRIGLVHGSTFDVPGCQTNFPIATDAAIERGLDYLAIGDTHGFRFVPPDRTQPPTIYPGTPEPTAFDERDPGNVAVVFFNRRRRAQVQPEPVAHWTWEDCSVGSLAELRTLRDRSDLERRVLRLRVEMRLSAPEYEQAERLLDDLQGSPARHGRAGVLVLDREGLALQATDVEAYCGELPEVLQMAVRRLQERAAASDPHDAAVAQRALYHLYKASRAS